MGMGTGMGTGTAEEIARYKLQIILWRYLNIQDDPTIGKQIPLKIIVHCLGRTAAQMP